MSLSSPTVSSLTHMDELTRQYTVRSSIITQTLTQVLGFLSTYGPKVGYRHAGRDWPDVGGKRAPQQTFEENERMYFPTSCKGRPFSRIAAIRKTAPAFELRNMSTEKAKAMASSISTALITVLLTLNPLQSVAGEQQAVEAIIFESPPWAYYDRKGQIQGMVVDWLREISRRADLPIPVTLGNVKRIYEEIESGRSDISIELSSQQASSSYRRVTTIIPLTAAVFTRRPAEQKFLWESMYTHPVCVVRGGYYGDRFSKDTKIDRVYANDYRQLVKQVSSNRCHYVVAIDDAFRYTVKQLGFSPDNFVALETIEKNELFLIYSLQTYDDERAARLREAIDQLKKEGFFTRIRDSYLEPKNTQR